MTKETKLFVFVPYWNPHTKGFTDSLAKQTDVSYRLITRDRKKDNIMWTKALRDFQKECKRFLAKDSDVICVMNNDVEFGKDLFKYGSTVNQGNVFIAKGTDVEINWKHKQFLFGGGAGRDVKDNSFLGRCFFMALGDFKKIKFSRLLPHALADIDFGIRAYKKLNVWVLNCEFNHPDHEYKRVNKFSLLSYENPILWTIFLLKHPNRYTLLNIIKAWL